MDNPKVANGIALGVFFATLVLGLFLVAEKGPEFERPETRTRVIENSRGNGPGKRTSAKERSRQGAGSKSQSATYTLERPVGKPSRKSSLTIEHGSRSLPERALGESGLVGLQVALVVLASFLFAGLVQRALLGDFAVKIGNFELGALAKSSEVDKDLLAQVSKTVERTNKLKSATAKQKQQLDALTAAFQKSVQNSEIELGVIGKQQQELAGLTAKLEALEAKVAKGA